MSPAAWLPRTSQMHLASSHHVSPTLLSWVSLINPTNSFSVNGCYSLGAVSSASHFACSVSSCVPNAAVATAGTAHVTAIILCITRMGLAGRSKGVEKFRLKGSARAVHCIAATAAATNLLLVLFLLNGRIAADTILVVHGKLAPFEWVGKQTPTSFCQCLNHMHALTPICRQGGTTQGLVGLVYNSTSSPSRAGCRVWAVIS